MNFEKAMAELSKGKRIRRKDWDHLMHMAIVKNELKTYRPEITNWVANPQIVISSKWKVLNAEDVNEYSFVEALEFLKAKRYIYRNDEAWIKDSYIFVDGDQLAHCCPVEFVFTPSYKDMCANDWEIMK